MIFSCRHTRAPLQEVETTGSRNRHAKCFGGYREPALPQKGTYLTTVKLRQFLTFRLGKDRFVLKYFFRGQSPKTTSTP